MKGKWCFIRSKWDNFAQLAKAEGWVGPLQISIFCSTIQWWSWIYSTTSKERIFYSVKREIQMKIKLSIIYWLVVYMKDSVYQEEDVTRELGKASSMKFRLTTPSLHLDHFHCSGQIRVVGLSRIGLYRDVFIDDNIYIVQGKWEPQRLFRMHRYLEKGVTVKGGWTVSSFVQAQTIAASFLPKLPHMWGQKRRTPTQR